MPIQPIYLKIGPTWPNWQCCLGGSYKTAPRILIFSIAMGADYSFYVKSIATYAPAFLRHNNSVLARVPWYPHPKYLFWAAKNQGFSLRGSIVRALDHERNLVVKNRFSHNFLSFYFTDKLRLWQELKGLKGKM